MGVRVGPPVRGGSWTTEIFLNMLVGNTSIMFMHCLHLCCQLLLTGKRGGRWRSKRYTWWYCLELREDTEYTSRDDWIFIAE